MTASRSRMSPVAGPPERRCRPAILAPRGGPSSDCKIPLFGRDCCAPWTRRRVSRPRSRPSARSPIGMSRVVGRQDSTLAERLMGLGGWIRIIPDTSPDSCASMPEARADVLVAGWTGFRPSSPDWDRQLAQARRLLRPDGRLLVLHDYGRDEVTGLLGDEARASELVAWSRPSGPLLGQGFRIRVLHCWWRWDTLEEATDLLTTAFGDAGAGWPRVCAGPGSPGRWPSTTWAWRRRDRPDILLVALFGVRRGRVLRPRDGPHRPGHRPHGGRAVRARRHVRRHLGRARHRRHQLRARTDAASARSPGRSWAGCSRLPPRVRWRPPWCSATSLSSRRVPAALDGLGATLPVPRAPIV